MRKERVEVATLTEFTLRIRLGNDAMSAGAHVADALRKVADALYGLEDGGPHAARGGEIRDYNGNAVGIWAFEEAK